MSAPVAIPLAPAVRTLPSARAIGLPGPCLRLWERYIVFKKTQDRDSPSLESHLPLPKWITKIVKRRERQGDLYC